MPLHVFLLLHEIAAVPSPLDPPLELLDLALGCLGMALFVVDMPRLVYASAALRDLVGMTHDEPAGRTMLDALLGAEAIEQATNAVLLGKPVVLRTTLQRRGGDALAAVLEIAPLPPPAGARFAAVVRSEPEPGRPLTVKQADRLLLTRLEAQQVEIARELHDALGSDLIGVSMMLEHLRPAVAQDAGTEQQLERILARVNLMVQATRRLAHGLMPVHSTPGALVRAVEQLAADWSELHGVACTLRTDGAFAQVPAVVGTHVYRILQEAIVNAIRHGGASRIAVQLTEDAAAGKFHMTVDDNGSGLATDSRAGTGAGAVAASRAEGLGMQSARARAKLIRGRIAYTASPLGGVQMVLHWPRQSRH